MINFQNGGLARYQWKRKLSYEDSCPGLQLWSVEQRNGAIYPLQPDPYTLAARSAAMQQTAVESLVGKETCSNHC